jgi:archaemetzincin
MKKASSVTMRPLGIIQMGRLRELTIRIVLAHIQTLLGIPVDVLEPREVPADAFQHHRQQYDASIILEYLAQLPYPRYARIVALTSVDLCIPILTYVFGEAEVGGRVAVVSNFRLRHNEDGTTVGLDQYYERVAKVALHEVGHTLSIYHCENSRCLMCYSPRVHHLDKIELFFCERCEFILRENLKQLRR